MNYLFLRNYDFRGFDKACALPWTRIKEINPKYWDVFNTILAVMHIESQRLVGNLML